MRYQQALTALAILLSPYATFAGATNAVDPAPTPGCAPSGPLLPRPSNLGLSEFIKNATESLSSSLDDAVARRVKAGWDIIDTSFSIALVSPNVGIDNANSNAGIIWEYHHLGENNINGTKHLDGDSQYLVGSVSKIFSDLLLLKSGIDLNDPITKYLPQLRGNGSSSIDWDSVSLLSLSEHLAGIPANTVGAFQSYSLESLYSTLGFPSLEKSDYPKCGIAGLNKECTSGELLEELVNSRPVTELYARPIYSQLSFTLFSLALANKTGKSYAQMLNENIVRPLKLNNTGVSPGNDERAVIPNVRNQGWGADYGNNAPGDGLYSSLKDLSALVTNILDYSVFENPEDVRKWLQPSSTTSSLSTLVGQPWEILRTSNMTPEHPHTIDIYGKRGIAPGYISQISLIDQYGIGVVLSTAGPVNSTAAYVIYEAVLGALLPAVEKETRNKRAAKQKQADYTPIKVKVSMDDGPGLKLDFLTRNGSDILEGIRTVWTANLGMIGSLAPEMRIYPSGVERPVPGNFATNIVDQDWRINFELSPYANEQISELPGLGRLESLCTSWQTVDWLYYAGVPIDRIVFTVDKEVGEVIGVEIPFLRSSFIGKTK